MEERERARTGISSLKVRFNRVFGYYIEISKSNLHAVPADYHRKQTIAGGERFTTPALKEYEEKVLGADERILERELEIFEAAARTGSAAEAPRIQDTARALATLDVPGGPGGNCRRFATSRNPTCTRGTSSWSPTLAILWSSDLRRIRSCPTTSTSTVRPTARDPHRAEHGRQVHVSSADGAPAAARADRIVRPGQGREAADRRSHLRERGRLGQHRAWPVHVHGGDAGDRQHPADGHVAQPRRARRDRPRHFDVRRAEHRVGCGGTPRHQPERASEDSLCHALPRADRPGRLAPRRRQRTRGGARVEGRHHLFAQDRCLDDPIEATASRSPASRVYRQRSSARARDILRRPRTTTSSARGGRPTLSGAAGDPASSSSVCSPGRPTPPMGRPPPPLPPARLATRRKSRDD